MIKSLLARKPSTMYYVKNVEMLRDTLMPWYLGVFWECCRQIEPQRIGKCYYFGLN